MNQKTNTVLSKIRQTLETELTGANLQDAELTEAEETFIKEASDLITQAGYELEGFDPRDPDALADALEQLAAEERGTEFAESASELLAPVIVEAAGPVIATVPSSSNPSKSYEIRLGGDGNVYCSCPAWKYQKGVAPQDRVCKHMKGLAKQIAQVTTKMGKKAAEGVSLAANLAEMVKEAESIRAAEFIEAATALIRKAGYELDVEDGAPVEAYVEALASVAVEEGEGEISEAVREMLAPYLDEGGGGKTYIVYVNGEEKGMIKAGSHNAAEKKAQKLHPDVEPSKISVEYTEV